MADGHILSGPDPSEMEAAENLRQYIQLLEKRRADSPSSEQDKMLRRKRSRAMIESVFSEECEEDRGETK